VPVDHHVRIAIRPTTAAGGHRRSLMDDLDRVREAPHIGDAQHSIAERVNLSVTTRLWIAACRPSAHNPYASVVAVVSCLAIGKVTSSSRISASVRTHPD
jgi:hypothetical protein